MRRLSWISIKKYFLNSKVLNVNLKYFSASWDGGMADAVDSKSTDSNILWVQVSFPGPLYFYNQPI